MSKLKVSHKVLEATLDVLHRAGARAHEGIVLWLGKRSTPESTVTHVYEPIHSAASDYFHIPAQGMKALMEYLRTHDVSVLAQVHTHPQNAFHSRADDKWAIVRHLGALSLVLPYFARGITPADFMPHTATFTLTQSNQWIEVPAASLPDWVEVVS